jgi:hypothetical protein
MHTLRYRDLTRAIYISSLFFVIRSLAFVTFLVLLTFLIITNDEQLFHPLGIVVAVLLFSTPFGFLSGRKANCQLCKSPLMMTRKCNRHLKARKILGSYRLRVSISVLFTHSFRCQFCGERFSFSTKQSEMKSSRRVKNLVPLSSRKQAKRNPRNSKISLPPRDLD